MVKREDPPSEKEGKEVIMDEKGSWGIYFLILVAWK